MATSKWRPGYFGRVTRRRLLAGSAAGLGGAALVACGGGDNGSVTLKPEVALKPGAVFYAKDYWQLEDETAKAFPGGIFPGRAGSDLAGFDVTGLARTEKLNAAEAYESLLRANRGPGIRPGTPEYDKIVGRLAESWESSPDAAVYTFRLRPGVKFHNVAPINGREMDIDDWRTSYERFFEIGDQRQLYTTHVDRLEFPDRRTMVMRLKAPYSLMIESMIGLQEIWIMPKELNADPRIARTTSAGTNWRQLDKWEPSIRRDYKRFDAYWGGKPFIERWNHPLIVEYANAYAQFTVGNIIDFTPSSADALVLRKDVPQSVMIGAEPSSTSFRAMAVGTIDTQTLPIKDERVRIAMRRAVDWDKITDFLANKPAFASAGIDLPTFPSTHLPPNPAYWLDPRKGELGEASKNYLFDVAEAKKLLAAAGFPDGFEIDAYTATGTSAYGPEYRARVDLQTTELRKVGIVLKEIALLNQEYQQKVLFGRNFKGLMANDNSRADTLDYILSRYYESKLPTSAFPDPVIDDIAVRNRQEIDPVKRNEIAKEFQRYQAKKFYQIPVDGVFGAWSFRWPWLHNLNQPEHLQWLDPSMPKRNG